jgi:hypothetical protein
LLAAPQYIYAPRICDFILFLIVDLPSGCWMVPAMVRSNKQEIMGAALRKTVEEDVKKTRQAGDSMLYEPWFMLAHAIQ